MQFGNWFLIASALGLATVVLPNASVAQSLPAEDLPGQDLPYAVGDVFLLKQSYSRTTTGSKTSKARGRQALQQTVIDISDAGVVFEFDFPADTPTQMREREWKLPVEVLETSSGTFEIANAAELEARRDEWLARAPFDESACGQWLFTWTAMRIDCDIDTALDLIDGYRLPWTNIRPGAMYRKSSSEDAAQLVGDGDVIAAQFDLNVDALRDARARTEMVAAQVTGQAELTFEDALARSKDHRIEGSQTVSFTVDDLGIVTSRTDIVESTTTEPDGTSFSEFSEVTVARERLER